MNITMFVFSVCLAVFKEILFQLAYGVCKRSNFFFFLIFIDSCVDLYTFELKIWMMASWREHGDNRYIERNRSSATGIWFGTATAVPSPRTLQYKTAAAVRGGGYFSGCRNRRAGGWRFFRFSRGSTRTVNVMRAIKNIVLNRTRPSRVVPISPA